MSGQKLINLPPVSYVVDPLLPVNPVTQAVLEPFSSPILTITVTLKPTPQVPHGYGPMPPPQGFKVSRQTVEFTPHEWATVLYCLDQASASAGYYISGFFAKTVRPDHPGPSNLWLPVPSQKGLHSKATPKNYLRGHAGQYMVGQACTDGTSYAIANFNPMKKSISAFQQAALDVILLVSSVNDSGCHQWLVDPQDNDVGSTGDPGYPGYPGDPRWPVGWLLNEGINSGGAAD